MLQRKAMPKKAASILRKETDALLDGVGRLLDDIVEKCNSGDGTDRSANVQRPIKLKNGIQYALYRHY